MATLSKIYGPVMYLQYGRVPTVVISSVEAAEQVLKTQDAEFCNRLRLARRKRLSYNYVDMVFAPYGEYWREIRKVCVLELLSAKRVQSFKAVRAEEIDVLINSISSCSSNTTTVNLFEKATTFTHKTICKIALGSTACQTRSTFDNGGLTKLLREVAAVTSLSASDFFPKNVYLGGVDSTAVIINWAMTELVKNPKAMKKVQEEVRNHVGSKGKAEESDLDKLQYLKNAS
ncbi:cytochrome P450 71B37-like [Papaver somniferum]|uniref:cytochrome P450 71B37-like n=1 Tax=Papaver somniferum TaxID=3469 RepID=UPI000E704638|nr:cytochrome P450 71B37-like [Papaver somniferum]